jgi:hypothetical protein
MTHSPATTAKQPTTRKEPLSPFGAIFERSTTLPGESQAEFAALLRRTTLRVVPRDEFEMALIREYVDLTWDAGRLREVRRGVILMARERALASILYSIVPRTSLTYRTIDALVRGYLTGHPKSTKRVRVLLAEYDYEPAVVTARIYTDKADVLERLDKQIASLERRRGRVLVELERHREGLGRLMAAAVPADPDTAVAPTGVPPLQSTPLAPDDDERLGYRPWLHTKVEEPRKEARAQEGAVLRDEADPHPGEAVPEHLDSSEVAPEEPQEKGEARVSVEGEQAAQELSPERSLIDAADLRAGAARCPAGEVKAVGAAGEPASLTSASSGLEGESRHGH